MLIIPLELYKPDDTSSEMYLVVLKNREQDMKDKVVFHIEGLNMKARVDILYHRTIEVKVLCNGISYTDDIDVVLERWSAKDGTTRYILDIITVQEIELPPDFVLGVNLLDLPDDEDAIDSAVDVARFVASHNKTIG